MTQGRFSEPLHQLEEQAARAISAGVPSALLQKQVDEAVHHAKRKAALFRRCDSSTLLTALEHARTEISRLEGCAEDEDGEAAWKEGVHSIKTPPQSTQLASPSAAAAAVVGSLHQLAADVAEETKQRTGPSLRELSSTIRIQRQESADLRRSRDFDFEQAGSLTAAYYFNEDDFNPFASTSRVPGSSMGSLRSMSSAHSGGWGAIGGQRSAPHSRTGSELVAGSVEREQEAGASGLDASRPQSCPDTPHAGHDVPMGRSETLASEEALEDAPEVAEEEEEELCLYSGAETPPKHVLQRLATRLQNMRVQM